MWRWLGPGLFGIVLAGTAWAQGPTQFDGQYVGELRLKGIIAGDCTKPPLAAVYPLTVASGEFRFSYVPRFDTTLVGTVDAKGNLKATARVPSGLIRMTGHVDGTRVTASITSPSCEYTFRTR